MSKQDFELIARLLKAKNHGYILDPLAVDFALELKLKSKSFDTQRFLTACGCSALTVLANK